MPITIVKPQSTVKRVQIKTRERGRRYYAQRDDIFREQEYKCAVCHRYSIHLVLDHKLPLHKGGTDDRINLQGICDEPCHRLKTQRERLQFD